MTDMNTKQNCASCKFFISGGILGECHRFPQAINKHDNDWCGEYTLFPISVDDLIYANDEIKNIYDAIQIDEPLKRKPGRPKRLNEATPQEWDDAAKEIGWGKK